MKRLLIALLGLCVVTAAYAEDLPLTASKWRRNGISPPQLRDCSSGLCFDFPKVNHPGPNSPRIGYLTTNSPSLVGATSLAMTFRIDTVGAVVWNYKFDVPGPTPANVRLFFAQRGYDPSAVGNAQYQRWWSPTSVTYLGAGTFTATALLDPSQWTSVYGRAGTYNNSALKGFNNAMKNAIVGMTFGGGDFAGHGVDVSGGTAKFTLLNYTINRPTTAPIVASPAISRAFSGGIQSAAGHRGRR